MNALNTDSPAPPIAAPSVLDQRPLAAVLWMILAGLCFISMTATVKYMGSSIPAAQSAFLRYLLGMVFVLPMLAILRREAIAPRTWLLFVGRGAAHTFAVVLWFYAMTRIPLAEITAMSYLQPIFVTLGAALFLGETLRLRRIVAIAAAIIGALIVLRPGLREIDNGHLAMLAASVFFGSSYLFAKRLTGLASPTMVVAMMGLTVTVGLAPMAAVVWVPVTLVQLSWLMLVASFATLGHYAMTFAFAAAPITVTQPVTALQLVWSVLLGVLFFGEPVDAYVIAGGGLIVAAVVFIALREHQLRRAQARAAVVASP